MLTRKESLARIQVLANKLGRSIPRKDLSGLSDKQLQDFILHLREQDQFVQRAWAPVGAQVTARVIARR